MVRSLSVSKMRVVIVAIVSHPSPMTIGNTAFPFSPIFLKILLVITASLGRYPESSINPKTRKKQPTMGKTMAMA